MGNCACQVSCNISACSGLSGFPEGSKQPEHSCTADTYGHVVCHSFTCLVKTLPLDASFGTTGVNNSVSTSCLLKTAGGEFVAW